MSRWWRADAVAIHAQAYQRSPLEPAGGADFPAPPVFQQQADGLRAGQLRARVQVRVKFDGTRSTYAWPLSSKNSRNWVQLP